MRATWANWDKLTLHQQAQLYIKRAEEDLAKLKRRLTRNRNLIFRPVGWPKKDKKK